MSALHFRAEARDGEARAGRLTTPHGEIATPAFMSVATYGAVRGIRFDELTALGAQILLANTYHLHERPGESVVQSLGGLHGFTGWQGPWLTDSGGYQVFSLAHRMKLDDDGITFASPLDGKQRRLTPEGVIAIQEALGSDIAMVLDECQRPFVVHTQEEESAERAGAETPHEPAEAGREAATLALIEAATERTLRWAERSARARKRADQAVFGIVQGGLSHALRAESARATAAIGFDGYAHGGLGLGEDRATRSQLLATVHAELPAQTARYLMGLGRPLDLLDGVAQGVDLFDCVVPTRNGRHGVLFTSEGVLHLRNARFREDPAPPDPACDCPTCASTSRAYLRHLFHTGEGLAGRLATLHNLRFYLRLLQEAGEAIREGRFAAFYEARSAAFSGSAVPPATP